MNVYASTFPAGFKDVIAQAMKQCVPDGAILHMDDGVVLYKSGMRRDRIISAPCFTNTYRVYSYRIPNASKSSGKLHALTLYKQLTGSDIKQMQKEHENASTFRIMSWEEGNTSPLDKVIRNGLEEALTINNKFVVNRLKPKCEFAFHLRRGGWGFFGLRLTYPDWQEKKVPAGRLDPEIAYLMCTISQPSATDVVLDPMAGHGVIAAMRATHFPYKMIIATDRDPDLVHGIKAQYARLGKQFVIGEMDISTMDDIPDTSINAIITDPPWGLHDESIDTPNLYEAILTQGYRVLAKHGVVVLLSGQKELVDELIKTHEDQWQLHNKWNILVHGRKAAIYKLAKKAPPEESAV